MSDKPPRTFSSDFKQFFLRGLVVLLPSVLTLWIVVKAYQFVDGTIAEPINQGVRIGMTRLTPYWDPLKREFEPTATDVDIAIGELPPKERPSQIFDEAGAPYSPPQWDPVERTDIAARVRPRLRARAVNEWWAARWYMDFIGLIVAILAVYIAGRLLGGFFGRRIYRRLERFIISVPVFKQVYPYVKQIVDFLFGDEPAMKFNRVVVCEYPRKGIWSVGFLTGSSMKTVATKAGDSVTVFIPSSPTPFTGYTITVPREEVMELPISVEEAIRFAVSGGVLVPDHESLDDEPPEGASPAKAVKMAADARRQLLKAQSEKDLDTMERERRSAG